MIASGERVGSKALVGHISDRQYLLTMHGHIHEAPKTSGKWHARIGDTLCVQPGATPPRYVLVDLENGVVKHPVHGQVKI